MGFFRKLFNLVGPDQPVEVWAVAVLEATKGQAGVRRTLLLKTNARELGYTNISFPSGCNSSEPIITVLYLGSGKTKLKVAGKGVIRELNKIQEMPQERFTEEFCKKNEQLTALLNKIQKKL